MDFWEPRFDHPYHASSQQMYGNAPLPQQKNSEYQLQGLNISNLKTNVSRVY